MVNAKSKLISDSIKILTSNILSNIFSILYFIFITNFFTKIELASLSILNVITGLGVMLSGLGILPTIVKEIPKLIANDDKKTASSMIKSVIFIHFIVTLFIVIVCISFVRELTLVFFKTEKYTRIMYIIFFNIISYKLLEDGQYILTALQMFTQYSLVRLYEAILLRIVSIIGYFIGGIETYLLLLIISNFVIFLYIIYLIRDLLKVKSGIFPLTNLISYSLPFYGNAYTNFFAGQGDQFIVATFLSPEVLAGYYVARRFYDYLSLLIDALTKPVFIKIAELNVSGIEKVRSAMFKTSKYLLFIIIPVCCFCAVSSYPLLQIYGGTKYLNSVPILVILSLTAIPSAFYSLVVFYIYIVYKPIRTFIVELSRAITNFILGLFFVRLLATTGIACNFFLSFVVGTLIAYCMQNKTQKIKIDWLILQHILISVALSCSIILLLQVLYYNIFIYPIYLLISVIIFWLLIRGKFSEEDKKLILQLLPINNKIAKFIIG